MRVRVGLQNDNDENAGEKSVGQHLAKGSA